MNPLSERSSKMSAKLIILSLWVFSVFLALPMLFFFEFVYVFDEFTGEFKPFCTLSGSLIDEESMDYDARPANETELAMSMMALGTEGVEMEMGGKDPPAAPSPIQKMTSFQTYNFLLSIVQVNIQGAYSK